MCIQFRLLYLVGLEYLRAIICFVLLKDCCFRRVYGVEYGKSVLILCCS